MIVADRDPPPLYTWEVYPDLYPSAPIPRGEPHRWGPGIVALLFAAAIVLAGLAAALAVDGAVTDGAGPYAVAGHILSEGPNGAVPLPGALVQLVGEAGVTRTTVTDALGTFRFASVAPGGISLNVSYPGLAPVQLELFASPFYATGSVNDLRIVLTASGIDPTGTNVETAFPDLESYLTSVGSAAVLLAGGAIAAGLAAAAARRRVSALVVAGGAGAAVAPVACLIVGLVPTMASVTAATVAGMVLGGSGAGFAAAYRWLLGPFEGDPEGFTPSPPTAPAPPGPPADGGS